ncbi:preflagellin peptidase FlaK [Methanobrevibacter gottschalkii]|uniref:Preflagellin peptidase FlaK n=3 Tax=Methanobrevibacter gottschalkii TaxID=190974 RepID=A0A3N5BQ55_9EURY|nr:MULTISPECIES: A24 family peptidase [Methanobrevibacter]MCQ2970289.1 A24 family peptidase [archaeon]RPF51898.1 preflagellin peptidase FlaK [Methanobrevibacter gottschalkii DSM 11977]SEL31686.1 preflagellin peptidase FlaK [Methanobrevibacter gottschalkii]
MIITTIFLIQIIITVLFSIMAAIYDIKSNIVPNKLNYSLIFFGLFSNLILSIISNNIKYILASFISMFITYAVTYMLWKLNIWGGGDVKLFTAIATVIPSGLNINFLNIFPQLSVYPFSFSVVINSILVSFPFLVIFVTHLIFKNKVFMGNIDFLVNIFNIESLKYIKNSTLNKLIPIKDLKEGMIVNDYYFNNEHIIELLSEMGGNLEIYKSNRNDFKYYFKSQSAGGITNEEVWQLKIMNSQDIISDNISIKLSFPFAPAIFLGLVIAIVYGDMMMLIIKNIFLVI